MADIFSQDTREKLEADLDSLTKKWHEYDGNYMRIYSTVAYAQVKKLLDRQAAITDAEWEDELEQLHMGYKSLIDELQAQLDKLSSDELHWHSEADYWKRQYELISRAVDDVARNYVDEGLA